MNKILLTMVKLNVGGIGIVYLGDSAHDYLNSQLTDRLNLEMGLFHKRFVLDGLIGVAQIVTAYGLVKANKFSMESELRSVGKRLSEVSWLKKVGALKRITFGSIACCGFFAFQLKLHGYCRSLDENPDSSFALTNYSKTKGAAGAGVAADTKLNGSLFPYKSLYRKPLVNQVVFNCLVLPTLLLGSAGNPFLVIGSLISTQGAFVLCERSNCTSNLIFFDPKVLWFECLCYQAGFLSTGSYLLPCVLHIFANELHSIENVFHRVTKAKDVILETQAEYLHLLLLSIKSDMCFNMFRKGTKVTGSVEQQANSVILENESPGGRVRVDPRVIAAMTDLVDDVFKQYKHNKREYHLHTLESRPRKRNRVDISNIYLSKSFINYAHLLAFDVSNEPIRDKLSILDGGDFIYNMNNACLRMKLGLKEPTSVDRVVLSIDRKKLRSNEMRDGFLPGLSDIEAILDWFIVEFEGYKLDVSILTSRLLYPNGLDKRQLLAFMTVELSKLHSNRSSSITLLDVDMLRRLMLPSGVYPQFISTLSPPSVTAPKSLAVGREGLTSDFRKSPNVDTFMDRDALLDIVDMHYKSSLEHIVEIFAQIRKLNPDKPLDVEFCNAYINSVLKKKNAAYLKSVGLNSRQLKHIIYKYRRLVKKFSKTGADNDALPEDSNELKYATEIIDLCQKWESYIDNYLETILKV